MNNSALLRDAQAPLATGGVVQGPPSQPILAHRHALRTPAPLVDLRLFTNRVFSASIITMVLMTLAVFGGMLLLPLYLQLVRGESALETGLLLAPQGLGAMLAMPIAGRLADRTGVGRIVPVGLAIILTTFWWLTGLEADTPYLNLGIALFFMGLGMGFTVILTGALTSRLGGGTGAGGGIGALAQLPAEQFARIQPLLAAAFGATFWWAVGFVGIAFVVALVLLPKRKPAPVEEDGGAPAATPPVVIH